MSNFKNHGSTVPVILILGSEGQVGWELQRSLACLGKTVGYDRAEIDLAVPDAVRQVIQDIRPTIIVNAAAYTAVDKAEEEKELAMQINGVMPGILAEEAENLNALLIHYSTDYVFNGEKNSFYTENDDPDPLNVYGESKLLGDKNIQSSNADYIIFRTTWVYASRGGNFVKSILRLAQERDEIGIVNDQVGAPTSARFIADVTTQVVRQILIKNDNSSSFESGIFNLAAGGEASWYDFAAKIIEQAKVNLPTLDLKVKKINPITTEQYPTPALRPKNSRLSTEKLKQYFDIYVPEWDKLLALCIRELE